MAVALLALSSLAQADFTITEGQPFSGQVVDAGGGCGPANASIYWGDGTPMTVGTVVGTGITGSHTYPKARTASGNVTYTCTQTMVPGSGSFRATVIDAALSGVCRAVAATAGQGFTAVVAHLDDANPFGTASDFSASVAWGDGSGSQAAVTAALGGGFDVTSTHTYAAAGTFTISTTIIDTGGASTTVSATAQVAVAPPAIPVLYAAPVVSGEARNGEPLATTTGNWGGAPSSCAYQWLRCGPAGDGCAAIAGASAGSYTAVVTDVGSTLRARVVAANAAGASLPADSAPTAIVAPLVIRARFTIAPNPTCTGIPVTFDASISKTPHPPITHYRFTERAVEDPGILSAGGNYATPSQGVVADGTSPRATETFGFDVDLHAIAPKGLSAGTYIADPREVTLTVTDGTGATNSYTDTVTFAQVLSTDPRGGCPDVHARVKRAHFATTGAKLAFSSTSITAKLPCSSAADCSGFLALFKSTTARSHARRPAVAVSAAPILLARSAFITVSGHHTAPLTAKLTAAGRALRRARHSHRAILRITTVDATGHRSTQSRTVTVPAAKR